MGKYNFLQPVEEMERISRAELGERFDEILEKTQIPRAKGQTVYTVEEALKAANELGYPVLVRPSYVLGGQGMQIAVSDEDVVEFMEIINRKSWRQSSTCRR